MRKIDAGVDDCDGNAVSIQTLTLKVCGAERADDVVPGPERRIAEASSIRVDDRIREHFSVVDPVRDILGTCDVDVAPDREPELAGALHGIERMEAALR